MRVSLAVSRQPIHSSCTTVKPATPSLLSHDCRAPAALQHAKGCAGRPHGSPQRPLDTLRSFHDSSAISLSPTTQTATTATHEPFQFDTQHCSHTLYHTLLRRCSPHTPRVPRTSTQTTRTLCTCTYCHLCVAPRLTSNALLLTAGGTSARLQEQNGACNAATQVWCNTSR